MKPEDLTALQDELRNMRANGKRVTAQDLAVAVANLGDQRQAEAVSLTLYAYPVEVLRFLVQYGRFDLLEQRKGYSNREAGRQMGGISHKSVGELVERATPNILAWLMEPKAAPRNIS